MVVLVTRVGAEDSLARCGLKSDEKDVWSDVWVVAYVLLIRVNVERADAQKCMQRHQRLFYVIIWLMFAARGPLLLNTSHIAAMYVHTEGLPMYVTNPSIIDVRRHASLLMLRITPLSYVCSPVRARSSPRA